MGRNKPYAGNGEEKGKNQPLKPQRNVDPRQIPWGRRPRAASACGPQKVFQAQRRQTRQSEGLQGGCFPVPLPVPPIPPGLRPWPGIS